MLLVLKPRCMLVAYRCKYAEFYDASENMRGHVRTSGVVTDVFRKCFLAAIWSGEARLNRYPGHSRLPEYAVFNFLDKRRPRASYLRGAIGMTIPPTIDYLFQVLS